MRFSCRLEGQNWRGVNSISLLYISSLCAVQIVCSTNACQMDSLTGMSTIYMSVQLQLHVKYLDNTVGVLMWGSKGRCQSVLLRSRPALFPCSSCAFSLSRPLWPPFLPWVRDDGNDFEITHFHSFHFMSCVDAVRAYFKHRPLNIKHIMLIYFFKFALLNAIVNHNVCWVGQKYQHHRVLVLPP
jgi:hypothetical protein